MVRVVVNRAVPTESDDLAIRTHGQNTNFKLNLEGYERKLAAIVDDLSLDLLEIAAAIFAADGLERRGGPVRSMFAASWHRDFHFIIPVRKPEFWSKEAVNNALVAAVSFLSDDAYAFTFTKAVAPALRQDFFRFGAGVDGAFQADDVILFSGGLDSLAGAVQTLSEGKGNVALVTHRSARKLFRHQNRLVEDLQKHFKNRVRWFPVEANYSDIEVSETSQRSRSFYFATLGFVTATMLGVKRLHFFENANVSLNLPISAQVIGAMATRTTHPLVLRYFGELFDLIQSGAVSIGNPFCWQTKSEVVAKLRQHGCSDLVRHSVSCSHVRFQTILHPHCGECSQCLDRRSAILAAKMQDCDPAEGYAIDLFVGERKNQLGRTLAIDWMRHALWVNGTTDELLIAEHVGDMGRYATGFPERDPTACMKEIIAFVRRHSGDVVSVLKQASSEHWANVVDQDLPETSMVRMFVADRAGILAASQGSGGELSAHGGHQRAESQNEETGGAAVGIYPLKVTLGWFRSRPMIEIQGLDMVVGSHVRIARELFANHAKHQANPLVSSSSSFVSLADLMKQMKCRDLLVQQYVSRCRRQLARAYADIFGEQPAKQLLIQNRKNSGYRLDPESKVTLIAPG